MSGKHQAAALQLLQEHSDGLTQRELQYALALRLKVAEQALASVPHRYVDRWKMEQGELVEVYCLAEIPPDAPHPQSGNNLGALHGPETDKAVGA